MRPIALAVALAALSACSGGNTLPTGPSPVTASVEFHYVLSQPKAPPSATSLPCAGQISLHPSWWGFAQVGMVEVGADRWAILFEDVPIGRHTLRLSAPDGCDSSSVSANGTLLSDRGDGTLGFTVHADGSVTP